MCVPSPFRGVAVTNRSAVIPSLIGFPSSSPFFENKSRAFWNLHLVGWGGWFVLRGVSGIANGQPWSFLAPLSISMITGFSVTLLLSVVYRHLIGRQGLMSWLAAGAAALLAAGLWSFMDAWVIQLQAPDRDFTTLLLGFAYIDLVSIGAWSALYFAINYYLQLEEQSDQMLRLEAQAASAQLAMLRYQLNPHFLFNTLNSISTLVLLKQTDPANAMLTRLAAFLRYTLANEPTAHVTLEQEVETLKLYLDIEKMRFEDRLRTRFEIDPLVAKARLPSLLLQPVIENAIKYAVSPQEDGADIVIAAQLAGQNLRISVSDNGPGLSGRSFGPTIGAQGQTSIGSSPTGAMLGHTSSQPNSAAVPALPGGPRVPGQPVPVASTGVGLVNIRERLVQAYGDRARFDAGPAVDGGFVVTIEMPFQTAATPSGASGTEKDFGHGHSYDPGRR